MSNTIIFCEECGHRNIVSKEDIENPDKVVKCSGCMDVLRVVSRDEKNPEVVVKKGGPDDKIF